MQNKNRFFQLVPFVLFALLISTSAHYLITAQTTQNDAVWQDVSESQLRTAAEARQIVPEQYRTLAADTAVLRQTLSQAPAEQLDQPFPTDTILKLPLPDGQYGRFYITQSPIMHPALAAKYPQIQTYAGQGIDDPTATARLDWTPHGFHAIIFSEDGTIYIDPYSRGNSTAYISYYKSNFNTTQAVQELPPLTPEQDVEQLLNASRGSLSIGEVLTTYRLAVAATGEYTAFHGGTVPLGLAAVVTAVNRVSGIYEKEVAVRLELVANNDQIIYIDSDSDPYSNFSGGTMLGQNQINIDNVIGSANYDVGHVFSTGGGGVAYVAVICNGSFKAQGVTGLPSPTGDPFYVDYVSHELGHQFGGTHTFNSTQGSCGGGNRSSGTAYEPGSGTTIMAYAGICGDDNTQTSSDDYFHTANFDQIRSHVGFGGGASCGTTTLTGNTAPIANADNNSYTIPVDTPFTLTGSATDLDGDSLTYSWEQFDLGPSGSPNNPSGNAPLFRSFSPTASPSRTFPQLSDIVNNTSTLGEILPGYGRSLTFRLTTRDNKAGGGGVSYDAMTVDVSDSAGPFLVTSPNTAVTIASESDIPVTWDVANTDLAPVNCSAVDISLSVDGGYTQSFTLISNTPNDGNETVTLPNVDTSAARIKVMCNDNIFFDISDADFTISAVSVVGPGSVTVSGDTMGTAGAPLTFTAVVSPSGTTLPLTYSWTATDLAPVTNSGLISDTVSFNWTTSGNKTVEITVSNSGGSRTDSFDVEILEEEEEEETTVFIYLPTIINNE